MDLDKDYKQHLESLEASKSEMTKKLEAKAHEERMLRADWRPMANIPEEHQKTLRRLNHSRLADALEYQHGNDQWSEEVVQEHKAKRAACLTLNKLRLIFK